MAFRSFLRSISRVRVTPTLPLAFGLSTAGFGLALRSAIAQPKTEKAEKAIAGNAGSVEFALFSSESSLLSEKLKEKQKEIKDMAASTTQTIKTEPHVSLKHRVFTHPRLCVMMHVLLSVSLGVDA